MKKSQMCCRRNSAVTMLSRSARSTVEEVRPIVPSVLTGAISTGVTLAGIGKYQLGLVITGCGCVACLLLVLTAKACDWIGGDNPHVELTMPSRPPKNRNVTRTK